MGFPTSVMRRISSFKKKLNTKLVQGKVEGEDTGEECVSDFFQCTATM